MEEKKRLVVQLGATEVDISDLPPLTLGDRKALKAEGIDFATIAAGLTPEQESTVVLYFLRKRRAETTMEEVDNIAAITASRIINYVLVRASEVDDPFLTRSTSSAQSTGGVSANSPAEPPLS